MSQGRFAFFSDKKEIHFKNFNEIIPNKKESRYFDIEEVEIYKIIFE